MLAAGVFWSGYLKDFVCLPRPLSPPVQRISRSSSAVLEYGFPSTHSTNAASVTVYSLYILNHGDEAPGWLNISLQCLVYAYAISIFIGRVYCGMHGFFDVVFGAVLGAFIAVVQCVFGDWFDAFIHDGPIRNILIVALVVLFLVRVHPEPADDCPCFDDSVAFSGVMIGIQAGAWHFARSGFAIDTQLASTAPFSLAELGYLKAVARIVLGVLFVFVWRGTMKPTLLKTLPPLFRVIEQQGLSLPRKFFLSASEYQNVPPLRKDDKVIPSAREIPAMLGSLGHPRKRTISVGPQSEADAYEAIAHRDRVRRASLTNSGTSNPNAISSANSYNSTAPQKLPGFIVTLPRTTSPEELEQQRQAAEGSAIIMTPADPSKTLDFPELTVAEMKEADEKEDRAMFAKLQVPRVRYDVEVVTKLIIYTGIGVIAAEGGPVLFELCGLGLGIRPS